MPTISSLSQISFVNWGPMTTTWTAPGQCSTQSLTIKAVPSSDILGPGWYAQCSVVGNDCLPTGTRSVEPTMPMASIPEDDHYSYFSPGLLCPAGYATVGVASRDADKPVTSSGSQIFPTTIFAYNPVNAFMQILEPSETAVFCCPSSMAVNPSIGCYSALKDYKPTTGCMRIAPNADYTLITDTYWYQGTTVTGMIFSQIDSSPLSVSTTSFAASETSGLVGVTIQPMVTLVHKASDLESAESTAKSTAATRLNSKPAESTATSNAATQLSLRSATWDGLGAVLAVSALGMILGAAIVLPF